MKAHWGQGMAVKGGLASVIWGQIMIGIEVMLGNLKEKKKKDTLRGENRKVQNSVLNIIYVQKDYTCPNTYILELYTEYFCSVNKETKMGFKWVGFR